MPGLYPATPVESLPRQSKPNGAAIVGGDYSPGAPFSVQIDRLGDLVGCVLRLSGNITSAEEPGEPTARIRNPVDLLGNVLTLTVNGKPEAYAHPDLLLLRAMWRRGKMVQLRHDRLTTTECGQTGVKDFALELPLDFMVESIIPSTIGLLFGEGASSPTGIELRGTWGAGPSSLMTNPGDQVVTASLSLEKSIVFAPRGGKGGFDAMQARYGFGHWALNQPAGKDVTSTGAKSFSVDIPGGRAYAGLYLRAVAGSDAQPSDAPWAYAGGLTRIKRGTEILFERATADCISDTAAGLPNFDPTLNGPTDRSGWLVIDPLKGYRAESISVMSRLILSGNGQPLTVEVDAVAGTGHHIDLMTEEMIDPESSASQRYARVR